MPSQPRCWGSSPDSGVATEGCPMARFTNRYIAGLRPKSQRYEVWGGSGFGIRVSPSGARSWVLVYHFGGRSRRMTLGSYPAMGLADAHIKLAQARKLLQNGVDP